MRCTLDKTILIECHLLNLPLINMSGCNDCTITSNHYLWLDQPKVWQSEIIHRLYTVYSGNSQSGARAPFNIIFIAKTNCYSTMMFKCLI